MLTGPLATAIGDELGIGDTALTAWSIAKWPLLFAAVVIVIALLYRFSPNARHAGLRWILPGSLVATVLWIVASAGFSLYVANFGSYSSTYGSLAGGIVLLLWLWLTNLAVVFGAQFAAELERTARAADHATPPQEFAPFVSPPRTRPSAPIESGDAPTEPAGRHYPPPRSIARPSPSGPASALGQRTPAVRRPDGRQIDRRRTTEQSMNGPQRSRRPALCLI